MTEEICWRNGFLPKNSIRSPGQVMEQLCCFYFGFVYFCWDIIFLANDEPEEIARHRRSQTGTHSEGSKERELAPRIGEEFERAAKW